jgi:hypothetical protein
MENSKKAEGINRNTYAGKAVVACQTKARGVIGKENETFMLLNFMNLLLLNNKFANKGIFITDDNKEECYIKIIELGEESLINDLEQFINLKDEVKELEKMKEEYTAVINKLHSLQDPNDADAVNKVVEDYLRK